MKADLPALSRGIGAATGVFGGWLLVQGSGSSATRNRFTPSAPRLVLRVLGVRYLAQAAAEIAFPERRTLQAAAVVDTLHGLSMVASAVAFPAYRRPSLASAAAAGASAVATLAASTRSGR